MTKITLPVTAPATLAASLVSSLSKATRTSTPTGKVYYGEVHNLSLAAHKLDAGGHTVLITATVTGESPVTVYVNGAGQYVGAGLPYLFNLAQEVYNILNDVSTLKPGEVIILSNLETGDNIGGDLDLY